jgi:hypothetical protein
MNLRIQQKTETFFLLAKSGKFSLYHRVQTASGAHPSSYLMGTKGLSPRVKRPPELEADHTPPRSADVTNTWSSTSTPPYVFMARCSTKHGDNFTFNTLF